MSLHAFRIYFDSFVFIFGWNQQRHCENSKVNCKWPRNLCMKIKQTELEFGKINTALYVCSWTDVSGAFSLIKQLVEILKTSFKVRLMLIRIRDWIDSIALKMRCLFQRSFVCLYSCWSYKFHAKQTMLTFCWRTLLSLENIFKSEIKISSVP